MRVLHVIPRLDPRHGGPAAALPGLTTALARAGVEPFVLAAWFKGDDLSVADKLRSAGVPVELIGPCHRPNGWKGGMAAAVQRSVRAASIVHIHTLWESIQHAAASACRQNGVPYIFRPCGMLDPWALLQSYWRKRFYIAWRLRRDLNRAAAIHYTTRSEMELAEPLKFSAPALVVPNGVDLSEFAQLPPRGSFRSRYPQLADRKIVLFMGRIHAKKGFDQLIPAFAQVNDPSAMLVIAGPDLDGYGATVRAMVEAHHLQDRVIFTGMLRGVDRIAALAEADLFVLPSYQENFGIAVVEALAAGTPVIVSEQVNLEDQIAQGGVGQVVPIGAAPLAAALQTWLSDDARRLAAAQRAAPFVRERFDWNAIAPIWAGHYARLAR